MLYINRGIMDIFPIACESLGTRSFAHFVITEDISIFIDPSVSLAPTRFGLPPHPIEIAVSWISRRTILELIKLADVLIQTHYHADHFTMYENRIYDFTNKKIFEVVYSPHLLILAKDPEENLNKNQRKRARWLWRKKGLNIKRADKNIFKIGNTEIKFSPAVPHGYDTKRGCVIETLITDSELSYLYTSDVSGPSTKEAISFIFESNPNIVVLDGPTTYHPNVSSEEQKAAFKGLKEITNNFSKVYIDHHFLRTLDWRKILKKQIRRKLPSFSQIQNQEPILLEARRKELHKSLEVEEEFFDTFHTKGYPFSFFEEQLKFLNYNNYWKKTVAKIKEILL